MRTGAGGDVKPTLQFVGNHRAVPLPQIQRHNRCTDLRRKIAVYRHFGELFYVFIKPACQRAVVGADTVHSRLVQPVQRGIQSRDAMYFRFKIILNAFKTEIL